MVAAPAERQLSGDSGSGERREDRRELFGVRRTVKAAFKRAAGGFLIDDEPGSDHANRRLSFFRRGDSIVSSTEAFTETALAAKNDELRALASKNDDLERVLAATRTLAPGVAEVLSLLSRATEAHAAAHTAEAHGAISSSHRSLLNAALQAQAALHSLLQEHTDVTGALGPLRAAAREQSGMASWAHAAHAGPGNASWAHAAPPRIRTASDFDEQGGPMHKGPPSAPHLAPRGGGFTDTPGLAPSGMAPSRGLAAQAWHAHGGGGHGGGGSGSGGHSGGGGGHGGGGHGGSGGVAGMAATEEDEGALTWTGALGVSDVLHDRIYADEGTEAAPVGRASTPAHGTAPHRPTVDAVAWME